MKNPTVTLFSSVVLDTYQTISYNRLLLIYESTLFPPDTVNDVYR